MSLCMQANNLPSLHKQFMTIVAALVSSPSKVQFPPLTQAHTSTVGMKTVAAPLVSLASNMSGSVVISCKFQRKTYSPSEISSSTEFSGRPPRMFNVNSSPGSTTERKYTDSLPTLTLNVASAVMLGGKLSGSEEFNTCWMQHKIV